MINPEKHDDLRPLPHEIESLVEDQFEEIENWKELVYQKDVAIGILNKKKTTVEQGVMAVDQLINSATQTTDDESVELLHKEINDYHF